jgi:hypothetical protein
MAFRTDEDGFAGGNPVESFTRTQRIRGAFPNDVWVLELGAADARPQPSRCTQ